MPAAFRTILAEQHAQDIILRPSSHSPCIDGWAKPAFQAEVRKRIGEADPFDADYDELTDDLTVEVYSLRPDAEGRIILPKDLAAAVPLDPAIWFIGRDKFFQIWSQSVWNERAAARRKPHQRREPAA